MGFFSTFTRRDRATQRDAIYTTSKRGPAPTQQRAGRGTDLPVALPNRDDRREHPEDMITESGRSTHGPSPKTGRAARCKDPSPASFKVSCTAASSSASPANRVRDQVKTQKTARKDLPLVTTLHHRRGAVEKQPNVVTSSQVQVNLAHEGTATQSPLQGPALHKNAREYYPDPLMDPISDHPSRRPALPPRPPVQNDPATVKGKRSNDSSLSCGSSSSTRSSPCRSEASTNATTIIPEEATPSNPRQEVLRRYARLGFALDGNSRYPILANGGMKMPQSIGQSCHYFEISKGNWGYISRKVRSTEWRGKSVVFPRNITISTIVDFEARQRSGFHRDTSRHILRQLLLSEEMEYADVPYVLPSFYWIKTHLPTPHRRIPPVLRMQCNVRQRRVFHALGRIRSIEDNTALAKLLTGTDAYDNSLRLCALLELHTEFDGPFRVLQLLNRIRDGMKRLQYGDLKMNHLTKASMSSINNVVATLVHSLGQHLAATGCKSGEMQNTADALCLILVLSSETEVGKVFCGVLPMLASGEVALCYSLLLATGLADEAGKKELWGFLVRQMEQFFGPYESNVSIAISAIVVIIYCSGEGSRVLFPWLYAELATKNLQSHAKRAWELLGGNPLLWDAHAEQTEALWNCRRTSGEIERLLLLLRATNRWLGKGPGRKICGRKPRRLNREVDDREDVSIVRKHRRYCGWE